jgi:NADPH2:quinone reductase
MGATLVLNSSDPDFDTRLKESCQMHAATVAFDPVAGPMTGRVLAAMPEGSTAIVYGSLSDEAVTVRPEQFIYEGKRVEGFWLSKWVARKGLLGRAKMALGLQKRLATDFQTEVRARVTLDQAAEAIEAYKRDMTGGKVLIMPGGV